MISGVNALRWEKGSPYADVYPAYNATRLAHDGLSMSSWTAMRLMYATVGERQAVLYPHQSEMIADAAQQLREKPEHLLRALRMGWNLDRPDLLAKAWHASGAVTAPRPLNSMGHDDLLRLMDGQLNLLISYGAMPARAIFYLLTMPGRRLGYIDGNRLENFLDSYSNKLRHEAGAWMPQGDTKSKILLNSAQGRILVDRADCSIVGVMNDREWWRESALGVDRLAEQLQRLQDYYGDLEVSRWDGRLPAPKLPLLGILQSQISRLQGTRLGQDYTARSEFAPVFWRPMPRGWKPIMADDPPLRIGLQLHNLSGLSRPEVAAQAYRVPAGNLESVEIYRPLNPFPACREKKAEQLSIF